MAGRFLSQLRLSQFRSHAQTLMSLDARPVTISGANGVGKTNILEAVSLCSPGRGLRRATASELSRSEFHEDAWKISATFADPGGLHELELSYSANSGRSQRIDGKAVPQLALGRHLPMIWLVPAMDRLWIEGAEGRRRFLDRMVLSLYPEHGARAIAYEKAMRERNRLLKDQIRDPHWYYALERQMAEHGAEIWSSRAAMIAALNEEQAQGGSSFPQAQLSLQDVAFQVDPGLLLAEITAHRPQDVLAGRSLIGPHRSDLEAEYLRKSAPARACSTGEQKALLISIILANARLLSKRVGAPPIILLDEIAAHLDPGRRAVLYDEIVALGAQVWMTGTEPGLFADLGDGAQHVLVTEHQCQSVVALVKGN